MKTQNLSFNEKTNVMMKSYDKGDGGSKKRSMSPVSKTSSKYPKSGSHVITMNKTKSRGMPRKMNLKKEGFGIY